MYNFLDRSTLQKVQVLHHIFNEKRYFSSFELAQNTQLSERTILKILAEISSDLQVIIDSACIKKKKSKYFKLEYQDHFSIKTVERHYLQNSLTYKACDEIFHNTFDDITTFSLDNFTSLASMYRRINKIKPLLNQFHLKYKSHQMVTLEGTEKQFRYFYYLFYWNSCWGEIWPFTLVTREQIMEVLEDVNLVLPESMIYWLAICLTRAKLGFLIEDDPMYSTFTKHHYHYDDFSTVARLLFKKITTLSDEDIELELMFSFNFISCLQHYDKKDKAISLMMNFAQHHNQELFVQATLYWIETFMNHFSIVLNVEEYGVLFVNLLYLHYYIMTFSGPLYLFKEDIYKKRFEMLETAQIEIMNQFYDRLVENEEFSIIFKRKDTLIGRYHKLLKQSIDIITRDAIKIKIVSMLNDIPYLFDQIKRTFVHVELCSTDEEADLIITDRLYLNIKKETQTIFVWNSVPKKGDYERLGKRLQEIYFNKNQLSNNLLIKTLMSEI
ncbi:helix-turn-helix domain-containing protein [Lysinibacillus parviboronicapiens]|uniref:helix-turn-helix domain-containing protein n=1 Tax=Lysinibacillus parviboronicapiens TaxID=436516 RepID=UPI000D37ED95|nr:helix-turn-helix domain-containing protein [Lysinibacillus parviboronicapiens]